MDRDRSSERGSSSRRRESKFGGKRGFDDGPEKRKFDRDGPSSSRSRGGGGPSWSGGRGGGGPSSSGFRGGDAGGPSIKIYERRLRDININGPTLNLEPLDTSEKLYSSKSKIFIGNIDPKFNEERLKKMLEEYGRIDDLFYNPSKYFAFVRFDHKANADKCKKALDGKESADGRHMKVRYAPSQASVKVKNLGPMVSNELLYKAFSIFGSIEKAKVLVDEKGVSTGEGIVDFLSRKGSMEAMRVCEEYNFVLTKTTLPVVVETYECPDDEGVPDALLPKNDEYMYEREAGPRFVSSGSFEHMFCEKYKQLTALRKQKMETLEKEMALEEKKLWTQMEYAQYQHETDLLRRQLQAREEDREKNMSMISAREMEVQREMEMVRETQKMRESMFDFNLTPEMAGMMEQGGMMDGPAMMQNMMMMQQMMGGEGGAGPMMGGSMMDDGFDLGDDGKRPRFPHEVFGRGGGSGSGRSRGHRADDEFDSRDRREFRQRSPHSRGRDEDSVGGGIQTFGRGGGRRR